MTHLSELTAREAAAEISNGTITSEKLMAACIERVNERERELNAWAYFDSEQALEAARAGDRAGNKTPLSGVPVGVKDIIDTHDMPTAYGSPIYKGHRPASDATCVMQTRRAGGIIMGKTATTEFAHQFPAKTCNPHNPAHTPGGSSSGSAAGMASFMFPLAFGTQTGGSVIRPASFCGVVGYKPTYGEFGLTGVKENAQCCDTVGLYARTVDDIALFRAALLEQPTSPLATANLNDLRIGVCRSHAWEQADSVTQNFLLEAASNLSKAGGQVSDYTLPKAVGESSKAGKVARSYELRRALFFELTYHPEKVSEACREGRAKDGASVSPERYRECLALMAEARDTFSESLSDYDVLITPATTGEAPKGLKSTGNSAFNDLWTSLHVPCLTLPMFKGPNGLPIGLQVIGRHAQDQRLLAAAQSIRRALS